VAALIEPHTFHGRKTAVVAAIIAVLGFIGLAIGLAVDPARTWLSYLMAFAFVFTLSVGALILLMSGYAANARWMAVVRRANELLSLPMPALVVLFVPILFGLDHLYPWSRHPAGLSEHAERVLRGRAPYANTAFFIIRAAIYFAILITASYLLRRWSVRRDADRGEATPADVEATLSRERMFASAMLPPVGLALTFAGIDWIMGLETVWYSSMFGFYVFAGGFLAALAGVTIIAARLWHRDAAGRAITPNHFYALGRLLFAFTVFWAYITFFQAMLIRIADKPEEVVFYLKRIGGTWTVLAYVLVLGHFALPFLALLLRAPKFRPNLMAVAGWWLVVMHLVDVYWLVIPSHVPDAMPLHWLDLAALAAVVGTSVVVAAWRQHGVPLVAQGDPYLPAGAAYRSTL
jgi:hypothetical protein